MNDDDDERTIEGRTIADRYGDLMTGRGPAPALSQSRLRVIDALETKIHAYDPEAVARKHESTNALSASPWRENLSHLLWMLAEVRVFEADGKAWRWLGFVQGVLYADAWISIDGLRSLTREAIGGGS